MRRCQLPRVTASHPLLRSSPIIKLQRHNALLDFRRRHMASNTNNNTGSTQHDPVVPSTTTTSAAALETCPLTRTSTSVPTSHCKKPEDATDWVELNADTSIRIRTAATETDSLPLPTPPELPTSILQYTEPYRMELYYVLLATRSPTVKHSIARERNNVILTCTQKGTDTILEVVVRTTAKEMGYDCVVFEEKVLSEMMLIIKEGLAPLTQNKDTPLGDERVTSIFNDSLSIALTKAANMVKSNSSRGMVVLYQMFEGSEQEVHYLQTLADMVDKLRMQGHPFTLIATWASPEPMWKPHPKSNRAYNEKGTFYSDEDPFQSWSHVKVVPPPSGARDPAATDLASDWTTCVSDHSEDLTYKHNSYNIQLACRAMGAEIEFWAKHSGPDSTAEVECIEEKAKKAERKVKRKSVVKDETEPEENSAVSGMYHLYNLETSDHLDALIHSSPYLDKICDKVPTKPSSIERCLNLNIPFLVGPQYSRKQYYVQYQPPNATIDTHSALSGPTFNFSKRATKGIRSQFTCRTMEEDFRQLLRDKVIPVAFMNKVVNAAVGMARDPSTNQLMNELDVKIDAEQTIQEGIKTRKKNNTVRISHLVHAFRLVQRNSISRNEKPFRGAPTTTLRGLREEDESDDDDEDDEDGEKYEVHFDGEEVEVDYIVAQAEDVPGNRFVRFKVTEDVTKAGIGNRSAAEVNRLAREFDSHEKKMWNCVVQPETITTGFQDVHLPDSSIKALQKSIILPLLRPDLFATGVLSRQGLSGILLFGPPGTGKTLVAKAVAKESGCTMMNVNLASLQDKWLGESEKNIRAVFTLARKLAPTVLFVDELDALFSSRSGDTHESRRQAVNEFMGSWDGLQSEQKGVIVLGATNRPFDLDDAVLRRLPRRILVDLPKEDAREAILRIHLRDQEISPDVNISDLAKRTERWSGSDLKHLCVSAALNAVTEHADVEILDEIRNLQKEKEKADGNRKGSTKKGVAVSESIETNKSERTEPGTLSSTEDVREFVNYALLSTLRRELNTDKKTAVASTKKRGRPGVKDSPAQPKSSSATTDSVTVLKPLELRHFEQAFLETTSSVSDDMESVVALRKWDAKFGGTRVGKKGGGTKIGFLEETSAEPSL